MKPTPIPMKPMSTQDYLHPRLLMIIKDKDERPPPMKIPAANNAFVVVL